MCEFSKKHLLHYCGITVLFLFFIFCCMLYHWNWWNSNQTSISSSYHSLYRHFPPPHSCSALKSLSFTTANEAASIIHSFKKTYSPLYSFPSHLILASLPILFTHLVSLFNILVLKSFLLIQNSSLPLRLPLIFHTMSHR